LVTDTDGVGTDVIARIIAGNKCYHVLGHVVEKRYIMHSYE